MACFARPLFSSPWLVFMLCLLLAGFLPIAFSAAQPVVHVTPTGSGLANGADWSNALPGDSLARRLKSAAAGTQFWLAGGRYQPTASADRYASFSIASGTQVYGGFAGTETDVSRRTVSIPSSTTLSGDIGLPATNTDNCFHVVRFDNVSAGTLLDGVVITAGYANGPSLNGSIPHNYGAGLFNNAQYSGNSSAPSVNNCTFLNNTATYYGGAVYNGGALQAQSTLTLTDCEFIHNTGFGGGAIFNETSATGRLNFQAIRCTFTNNQATYFGGAVSNRLRTTGLNTAAFTNCRFIRNTAGWNGGGIHNGTDGGNNLTVTITNSLFIENTCRYGGAGIDNDATGSVIAVQVTNSTFSNNTLIEGFGAAMHSRSFRPSEIIRSTILNSIIWANDSGIYDEANAVSVITYSDIQDRPDTLSGASGNRSIDPQFVDPATADYRLTGTSPLINTGAPGSTTTTSGSIDLAGNSRFYNGRIDMGAYEFQAFDCSGMMITIHDGLWTDPATWSCGRVPGGTDTVHINHIVTLPDDLVGTVQKISYGQSGQVRLGAGSRLRF